MPNLQQRLSFVNVRSQTIVEYLCPANIMEINVIQRVIQLKQCARNRETSK